MRIVAVVLAGLAALLSGCVSGDEKEIDLLMRRTKDLNARLLVAEETIKDLVQGKERLLSLYADLSVRHKDLQFEVGLLRTRSQPFAAADEEKKAQERALEILKRLGTEDAKEWPKLREEIVAMGHAAVPYLLELYRSGGAVAMERSGEALRAIRDPRALAPLVVGLEHPVTRMISAEALGQLGVKAATKDLAPFLRDDKQAVRTCVAEAMGYLGDLSGVPILIERLEHDDPYTRFLAATSLKRLTGQSIDYDAHGAESERKASVEQWRKWWALNKARFELAIDLEAGEPVPGEKKGGGEKGPGKAPGSAPKGGEGGPGGGGK